MKTFLEAMLAGTVVVASVAALVGIGYLLYSNASALAQGFGAALAIGLLGGAARYFKLTRKLLHKVFFGKLFE